jgi:hypothetical protein
MPEPIHSTLCCFNSTADTYGNRYWALRFVDHATGKDVKGTVSGGESNIYAIVRYWNKDTDDWDRGIQFVRVEKSKREFKALVKDWPHAGCDPEELAEFIRRELAK